MLLPLKEKLKGKVLILGVGNTLKRDDGAGPAVVTKLKAQSSLGPRPLGLRPLGTKPLGTKPFGTRSKLKTNVILLDGGVAPENYTGKIKQIKPDTLIIVDAVDFGEKAGSIRIMGSEDLGMRSLSTHNISLKTFVSFLKDDLPNLNVLVIGIQPKEAGFGEGLSPEVEKAVDELCMSLV